ncbi:hypothetical protein FRC09_000300 [Ceratobasidium sp. 395]|nr:hypothetical protein FRC09_000300 [Ceratobasidium sp. 395]
MDPYCLLPEPRLGSKHSKMRFGPSVPPEASSANPPIDVPRWAFPRPESLNSTWDISRAQQAINYSPPSSTTNAITTATPSSSSTPTAQQSNSLEPGQVKIPAAPIAVVCVLALLIVLGMALWLYKRRNRVSPSAKPPPGFSIDEPGTPSHESGHDRVGVGGNESGGPGWMFWKKSGSGGRGKEQSRSDPGKIDAWHYPFEYTPVSVDASPPTGAGHPPVQSTQYLTTPSPRGGPYYDPYVPGSTSRVTLHDESDAEQRRRERRERRERRAGRGSSETNLLAAVGGRVSGETVRGLHGQTSHTTLRYSPSPTPGGPPGYTPSHRTYPPGLFGGTGTPYVPPTTPTHGRPGGHSPIPPSRNSPIPPSRHSPIPPNPHGHSPIPPNPHGHSPIPSSTSPLPPSTSSNSHQYTLRPQSPTRQQHPSQTHTFEVQLSPTQYADLRTRYPEIRVKTRRHRRRDRDRDDGGEGGAGGGGGERRGRPRSWSMPAGERPGPPSPEDQEGEEDDGEGGGGVEDGRPRNGPELAEKYNRRRRRRRGTDAVDVGVGVGVSVREKDLSGVFASGRLDGGGGRPRAVDGGVSLMGGPPRVR